MVGRSLRDAWRTRNTPRAPKRHRDVGCAEDTPEHPALKLFLVLVIAAAIMLLLRIMRPSKVQSEIVAAPLKYPPPGCHELKRIDRPKWPLPLDDPTFREICKATPIAMPHRGRCYRLKQRGVKCLPSFLVIGFTKSGTSVFFQYASQHNLVRSARIKEPAYLGSDIEFGNGTDAYLGSADPDGAAHAAAAGRPPNAKSLRWYMNLFPACPNCERGEATPGYAWRDFSHIAAAQARLLLGGGTKLLMLVREPIERAVSHYLYFKGKRRAFQRSNLSHALHGALDEFERCIMQLAGWRHQCTYRAGRRAAEVAHAAIGLRDERRFRPELWRFKGYDAGYELVQAGLYSEHLKTWRAQFAASAILVIDMALLISTPMRAMRRFERHLDLPKLEGYETSLEHALVAPRLGGGPKPGAIAKRKLEGVDAVLKLRLEEFFTPFNRMLKKAAGVGWEYAPHSSSRVPISAER